MLFLLFVIKGWLKFKVVIEFILEFDINVVFCWLFSGGCV